MNFSSALLYLCIAAVVTLSLCHCASLGKGDVKIEIHKFPAPLPEIGTPPGRPPILLGGFSGLLFEGKNDKTDRLRFITHTDRGPNPEPITLTNKQQARPFALPDYQPEWIRFELHPVSGNIKITKRIPLRKKNGTPLSGRPNFSQRAGVGDEVPVDLRHLRVPFDPMGLDPEGIARAADGTYWMVEEYRPSIIQFDTNGKMLERYVPQGLDQKYGRSGLPAHLSGRKSNRGFEGLAISGPLLYAFLQSPLPEVGKTHLPIVVFDIQKKVFVREIQYALDPGGEKIGDAAMLSRDVLLVIEQNSEVGPKSIHKLYKVDISGEQARKVLIADLVELGLDAYEKLEGLTVVNNKTVAILNDNDFGQRSEAAETAIAILRFKKSLHKY